MNAFSGKDPKAVRRAGRDQQVLRPRHRALYVLPRGQRGGRRGRLRSHARVRRQGEDSQGRVRDHDAVPGHADSTGNFTLSERILTRDWSLYNDANVVFQPAQMSPSACSKAICTSGRSFIGRARIFASWTARREPSSSSTARPKFVPGSSPITPHTDRPHRCRTAVPCAPSPNPFPRNRGRGEAGGRE